MLSFLKKEPGKSKYVQYHDWKISNVDKIRSIQQSYPYRFFVSPIFKLHDLKWFCKLYPNGIAEQQNKGHVDFEIFMEGLTPNLSEVSAKFRISLNDEYQSDDASSHIFSTPRISYGELMKPSVTTEQLNKLSRIKITVEIELIRVLDINGNIIIDTECDHLLYPKLNKDKKRSVSITSGDIDGDRMFYNDDDRKNDELCYSDKLELKECLSKMKEMEIKIQSLSKRVETLELMVKSEKSTNLYEWLMSIVQLPIYYDLFIQHGFHNLNTVSFITEDVLLSMGIQLIGHRKLIMFHVNDLNRKEQQSVDQQQEGMIAQYTNQ